jgi:magnesium chelatase family protein
MDLHVEVPVLPYGDLAHAAPGEPTSVVRDRVAAARARQAARGHSWNARLGSAPLASAAPLDDACHALLERAVDRFGLSARGVTRIRRVARTIADLDGGGAICVVHLAEALQYRVLDQPVN